MWNQHDDVTEVKFTPTVSKQTQSNNIASELNQLFCVKK